MRKNRIKFFLFLLILLTVSEGCVSQYQQSRYMGKTMQRFSVPKRKGMGRHFIRKGKPKLSPTYTKPVRDYYGN